MTGFDQWGLGISDGLTNDQWMILRARTQRILADAQADQEELAAQVRMLELGYLDAQDWLRAHPFPLSPTEFLLEELRHAREAGFTVHDGVHLASPRAKRRPRKYVPTADQLRIAMEVLDRQSNSKKENTHA